jgi:hypothetical protein
VSFYPYLGLREILILLVQHLLNPHRGSSPTREGSLNVDAYAQRRPPVKP